MWYIPNNFNSYTTQTVTSGATSSAILTANSDIDSSEVSSPLLEPSNGLMSRSSSYVVSCMIGTSKSRAKSAESSFSAMPAPSRRFRKAGVTSTIPTRDLASPLSISRSKGDPSRTSFSLNQTETPNSSNKSCNSLAAPFRSSQA